LQIMKWYVGDISVQWYRWFCHLLCSFTVCRICFRCVKTSVLF
jgi:hypothetical protein